MKSKIKAGDVFKTNQGCSCTVIAYESRTNILVEFNDKHKHQLVVRAKHLISGYIKNPYYPSVRGKGFIGVGEFKAYRNSEVTDEYKKWSSMLRRCYSKVEAKRRSSYSDCEVQEDWLDFQKFALWLTSNKHYKEDYQLDKDLLVLGNKVYSADTCCLVPTQINNLLLNKKSRSKKLPLGVKEDGRSDRFVAAVSVNAQNYHIGTFDTPKEAHEAYVRAKELHVKRMAREWRDRIDDRVYTALMSWRVAQ